MNGFSNCLSHQNHFNEHDMHNRSFRIIIIFFRLFGCGKSSFRSMGSASQATSGKRGFLEISSKMGFELESRHLFESLVLVISCETYRNVEKVACLYNEIIKMSPNTLESGSILGFVLFHFWFPFGRKITFEKFSEDLFLTFALQRDLQTIFMLEADSLRSNEFISLEFMANRVYFKICCALQPVLACREKDSVPFSARIEIEL